MRYGLCAPPSSLLPLQEMLQSHLQKVGGRAFWVPAHNAPRFTHTTLPTPSLTPKTPPLPMQLPLSGGLDAARVTVLLRRYVTAASLTAGQELWRVGDPAVALFIIEKGVMRVSERCAVLRGRIGQRQDEPRPANVPVHASLPCPA